MPAQKIIVSVAANVRAHQLFDYQAEGAPGSFLGRRVRVEFGRRIISAPVLAESATSPVKNLKPVLEVYSDMPPLPPDILDLIHFCASYYHAPPGIAAAAALPALFRRANAARLAEGWRLANNADAAALSRRPKAMRVYECLRGGACLPAQQIKQQTGAASGLLQTLAKEGFLIRDYYFPELPNAVPETPPVPTAAQTRALSEADIGGGYAPHLLFGDTGSGKTEVYMRLTEQCLENGGQALILTPEIHLTPQLEASFARRFPQRRLCVLHSALPDGERARRWLAARLGAADIVLGTRLAVFAPLPRLRLIVADEEHDESYKQEDGGLPFSARDAAVWRARRAKIPLVCGSATPSLESYENARRGRYKLLRLDARPQQGAIEKKLVHEKGALFHGMAQPFLSELAEVLARGEQALVFINRRGYAPMLVCKKCQWTVVCAACESRMTWHKRRGTLLCHRCGKSAPPPVVCNACGGAMHPEGGGTQRIEEALNARFAPLRAVRLDTDSLSGRGAFAAMREKISSGKVQLLVGTQIVSKGHNFPHLSFIGILNADAGLRAADFRAEERLLMQLWQVIGRGTRNPNACRVLIQTAKPEHPFYQNLLAGDLEECWKRLAEERRRAQLPPFARCALLRASALSEKELQSFFNIATRAAANIAAPQVRFFSAVPSPVAKIAHRFRWQLLAQSSSRAALHNFLSAWREQLPPSGKVRWHFDVDPLQI